MKYSQCKTAEDFDRLMSSLLELDNAYSDSDKVGIDSLPGVNPDLEEEYYSYEQMKRECKP